MRYTRVRNMSHRKHAAVLHTLLYAVMLIPLTAFGQAADVRPTEANVSERVQQFLTDIGQGVTGEMNVAAPNADSEEARWSVMAGNDYIIKLSADGTKVLSCTHQGEALARSNYGNVLLTKEAASERARSVLTKAGHDLNDFQLSAAEYIERDQDKSTKRWEIRYCRVYNGYRFENQILKVSMFPDDGMIVGLGAFYDTTVPSSVKVLLKQDEAVDKAGGYLGALGEKSGKVISCELLIVTPNLLYQLHSASGATIAILRPRLAWVIEMNAPWNKTYVWIDAADGNLLGGLHSNSRLDDVHNLVPVGLKKSI